MQEELAASSDTGLGLRAPSRIGAILGDRRLVLVILLLAGIAIQFWVGSRVPALNEKALMGGDTQLAALGFDTVFAVSEDDSMFVSVIYETVNWLKTNKRGMTFGVIFAATIMLLLTLIKKKSFRNPFANSLLGIVIGAPLGVCVNCAAPIAKGLYAGGARIETTLAAMISSPTLNVIVLTMLLSLFPLYLVILKLGFTIFFIVVFIPILVRILAKNVEMNPADAAACPIDFSACSTNEGNESWGEALVWVAKNWLLSFWNIVKTTVPLMFLAGFLGALLVTVLPWESMAEIIPRGGLLFTLGGMLLLSLVGIFLPVPIAFDVIITAILLAAGMPVRYAMVLLFTLGIYSVYSFFVIWREISRPMAVALWVVLVFFGLAAGIAADRYDKWNTKIQRQVIFETLSESANPHGPRIFSVGQKNENEIYTEFRASRGLERVAVSGNFPRDIAIAKANFFYPVGSDEVMFTRLVGTEVGITDPYSYSASKALLSMGRFRGVSSGDVHNDGWPDLLLTSFDGLSLYANRGDGQFVEQKIGPLPDALAGTQVVNSILVDLDGDGWLDVVFATYRKGNFVIYNRNGQFDSDAIQAMPNLPGAIITAAMGFGDIDRDGDLDVVFGNYGLGSVGGLTLNGVARILTVSHDALLLNDHGQFSVTRISPIPGDTLSTLLSDINSDGILDLMIGIDFDPADQFYFGDGAGAFTPITRQDEIIPYTGSTTMNIVTADINNDLTPELFVAQITGRTGSSSLDLLEVEPAVCNELEGTEYQAPCERFMRIQADMMVMRKTRNMGICQTTDAEFKEDCVASLLLLSAMRWDRDEQLCSLFPDQWEGFRQTCYDNFSARVDLLSELKNVSVPQQSGANILLFRSADGRFEDRAKEMGLNIGGWSWHARFADVNNDEWQDIYVVNGDFLSSTREANFFYANDGGKQFVNMTSESGLGSFLATSSYTYVDMDNDGDLDIVSVPEVGPVYVYRNNLQSGNAIVVELEDYQGNRSGIGSIITVHYGPSGSRQQMREIQSSGGFVSFDAPVAHFGLGEFDTVDRIEVNWSTGQQSILNGPFVAGARYRVTRRHAVADLSASPEIEKISLSGHEEFVAVE